MRGNNELRINEATMIEAIQQWIDAKMPHSAPTITHVRPLDGDGDMFVVELSSRRQAGTAFGISGGRIF